MKKLLNLTILSFAVLGFSSVAQAYRTSYTVNCNYFTVDVANIRCKAEACHLAKMDALQDCLRSGNKKVSVEMSDITEDHPFLKCDIVYTCK